MKENTEKTTNQTKGQPKGVNPVDVVVRLPDGDNIKTEKELSGEVKLPRCNDCKFFFTEDSGYSNYTVTETIAHCMKNINPHLPADESYSWNIEGNDPEQLRVAENCKEFKLGEPLWFDVDGEVTIDNQDADQEQKEAYDKYN